MNLVIVFSFMLPCNLQYKHNTDNYYWNVCPKVWKRQLTTQSCLPLYHFGNI